MVPPDYKDLEKVARKAASAIVSTGGPQYTVGPSGSTLYPASGGSDDWAKGAMKMKYTYTIELRDNGRYIYDCLIYIEKLILFSLVGNLKK